jgi:hypothetical protein
MVKMKGRLSQRYRSANTCHQKKRQAGLAYHRDGLQCIAFKRPFSVVFCAINFRCCKFLIAYAREAMLTLGLNNVNLPDSPIR